MRRRRKYRRLIAAALAAGLLAAPPASAREDARPAGPAPTTRPQPAPDAEGPLTWLVLIGLSGVAVAATGTAGARPRRLV
jgi:hypothetical protein